MTCSGAFQLYDIDKDGTITYDEMLMIVQSIYKMTGQMVKLPADEDTPEKVHHRLFPAERGWLTNAHIASGQDLPEYGSGQGCQADVRRICRRQQARPNHCTSQYRTFYVMISDYTKLWSQQGSFVI